ncbi:MAG: hypothetical protein AAGI38_21315, partial [Bacteroidota bacterium]
RVLSETENNCPDFEFVEYDFLELSKWAEEYETPNPQFKLGESIIRHNHESGNENLNEMIFEYLKPVVVEIKKQHSFYILLQLLDSDNIEVI